MTTLFHTVYVVATVVAAVSIGAILPFLRPEMDTDVGWLAGAVVLLAGGLVHQIITRREQERAAARRLDTMQQTVEALAGALARQNAILDEARNAGGGSTNYETVVQEVKLLQSLVGRLTEKRRQTEAPRPPGSFTRKPVDSGVPFLAPQAPQAFPSQQAYQAPQTFEEEAPLHAALASVATFPPAFTPDVAAPMDDASVLEVVRDALRADRIDIYLQPIVSLPQRKHRFYEVFSRVRGSDGALVMPDRYLDIAEREGLIAIIDNLLLVRCVQLIRETERRQHAIGFVSNISAATLSDADFMKHFLQLMAQNQALVPKLVFELSQEQLRAGGAVTMGILSQLARIGFRFSMDQVTDLDIDVDSLLRHDFRYLKLDRGLVLDPAMAPRIADLRRRIGGEPIDIIVEKIETEDQLDHIVETGFDFGQGYLFGEPRPSRKPA